jgi:hypothetical protein
MQMHHGVGPSTKPFPELDTSVGQPQIVHVQDTNMIAASLLYTEIGPCHIGQVRTIEGPNIELMSKGIDYLQARVICTCINKQNLDSLLPLIDDGLERGS